MNHPSCGILLHLTSLPSSYGIGTLGQAAYDFVDFLQDAGQSCWQILPIGPTGYGDSPYQSFSTFAGNPYLIDLDFLIQDGLLTQVEVDEITWGARADQVDFALLYRQRLPILRKAYERFRVAPAADFGAFCDTESDWLEDYALFMALKGHFGGGAWTEWPSEFQRREPEALAWARGALAEEIDFHQFLQYQFYRQWHRFRAYARQKGVTLMGDIPIYVPLDSADFWCRPKQFQVDPHGHPTCVAGCPPDGFSAEGQYWGNPIYDWDAMEQDGFAWWMRRIAAAGRLFDVIRIDHFRGIESYWSIPAGSDSAKNGRWVKGPGKALIDAIRSHFPDLAFVAEDLGFLTEDVLELVQESGFPGMKVLEFAFDPGEESAYLPHRYPRNCVCYTGTHDNATLPQWCQESDGAVTDYARDYLHLSRQDDLARNLLRRGLASKADLFIAQMQDYLGLGGDARMNEPGTLKPKNWRWRVTSEQLTPTLAHTLRTLAEEAGRLPNYETQERTVYE